VKDACETILPRTLACLGRTSHRQRPSRSDGLRTGLAWMSATDNHDVTVEQCRRTRAHSRAADGHGMRMTQPVLTVDKSHRTSTLPSGYRTQTTSSIIDCKRTAIVRTLHRDRKLICTWRDTTDFFSCVPKKGFAETAKAAMFAIYNWLNLHTVLTGSGFLSWMPAVRRYQKHLWSS